MLETGSQAPEFTLENENSEATSLRDLLSDRPLILYFYPADFTPGCTREACDIRDLHGQIQAVGLRVAGVSPQDAASHAQFRDKYELPFTLLCDPDKTVIRQYDVDGPFGVGVRRVTYLIDQDGRVADAVQADLRIGKHRAFIDRAIAMRDSA